jgi:hypothetical protein
MAGFADDATTGTPVTAPGDDSAVGNGTGTPVATLATDTEADEDEWPLRACTSSIDPWLCK